MPTIDSDTHVVETEHTWDYMDQADQKYRPLIVRPHGEGGGDLFLPVASAANFPDHLAGLFQCQRSRPDQKSS